MPAITLTIMFEGLERGRSLTIRITPINKLNNILFISHLLFFLLYRLLIVFASFAFFIYSKYCIIKL